MADAGEGPSTGPKRRRGPPRRPRMPLDPAAPAEPVLVHRRIDYRAPLVVPAPDAVLRADRRLRDHTFLQFVLTSGEYAEMRRLVGLGSLVHRRIDWDLIDQLGQRARIDQLLGPRWTAVLACEGQQFDELTVEFHSTWRYESPRFDHPESVSFSLGRQVYEMTVHRFAVALGFYTAEEVRTPAFEQSLRAVTTRRGVPGITSGQLETFWGTISDVPYTSSPLESSIRDPVFRFIHRILACTLVGRRSGVEKCSQLDLFCLYCIIGGHEANLASIFITSMCRPQRGGSDARLALGPYIGRLAESLGVFDRYPRDFLTPGPVTITYGLPDLRKAGMVTWDEPARWAPVLGAPPVLVGVAQMGVAPVGRRLAGRVERAQRQPRRGRRQAPLTLEALRAHVDDRLDRTDAAIRALMSHLDMPIPDFFAADAGDDSDDDETDAGGEAGPSGTAGQDSGDE